MITKWEVSQNARKRISVSLNMINWGSVLLIIVLFLVNSCAKSDDLEVIVNELPKVNEPIIIIQTDVEPDYSSEQIGDTYNLDLNNDLIVDFTLQSFEDDNNYSYLKISGNDDNKIISVTPWYSNPVPLNKFREVFNLIGSTNGESYESYGFFTIGDCFGGGAGCYEDWKNKSDKYLGLKFKINGRTYYGWAQLYITSPTQWVIKDYAYNATPNKPILAGEKN